MLPPLGTLLTHFAKLYFRIQFALLYYYCHAGHGTDPHCFKKTKRTKNAKECVFFICQYNWTDISRKILWPLKSHETTWCLNSIAHLHLALQIFIIDIYRRCLLNICLRKSLRNFLLTCTWVDTLTQNVKNLAYTICCKFVFYILVNKP